MLLKLDFHKAYDSVRWVFVDHVLQWMGFGNSWRSWIRGCLTSADMSIMVNGSPIKPFHIERGLRQWDPLSPFLFVLVAEVLNRLISKAEDYNLIDRVLVGRDEVNMSHLQFADNTILLCPTSYETIIKNRRILDCFGVMSGCALITINLHYC